MRLPFIQVDMDFLATSAGDLSELLRTSEAEAGWSMVRLWGWALTKAATPEVLGLLVGADMQRLAERAAGWKGEPGAFLEALCNPAVALAERETGDRIRLVGMERYAATYRKMETDRARKSKRNPPEVARNSSGIPSEVAGKTQTQTQTQKKEDPPKAPQGAGDPGKPPASVDPVQDAAGRLPFEAPEERHDPGAWTVADACDAVHRVVMGHGYAWDMRADELAATALMSLCAADKVPMSRVPEEIGRRFGRALVRMRDRFSTGKAATLKMLAVRECWRINATCPEVEEDGRGPDGVARRTRRPVEPWVDVLAEREEAA